MNWTFGGPATNDWNYAGKPMAKTLSFCPTTSFIPMQRGNDGAVQTELAGPEGLGRNIGPNLRAYLFQLPPAPARWLMETKAPRYPDGI
jgi:hypothetical protein